MSRLSLNPWRMVQEKAAHDFTLLGLKAAIIVVAILLIYLALKIDNKWVLGGIFAYEILP